ncbi:MAG: 5-formyltetrahydrofolate cyclo-ligase [Actinomycetota bacterium]|nr:5-formyltetrahydrofolate cyclo-ligase [Actinomycetota bacterium]
MGKRIQLAQRRKSVGCSQEQLAERLGVDRSTVARWEAGDTEPLPWLRPKLARILQVSRDQLDAYLDEATLTPTKDDDRLANTVRHPEAVDLAAVHGLRDNLDSLDRAYEIAPSSSLLAETGACPCSPRADEGNADDPDEHRPSQGRRPQPDLGRAGPCPGGAARRPRAIFPDFDGAHATADRLAELPVWKNARLLDPGHLTVAPEEAAAHQTAMQIGQPIDLDQMQPVDLVVCGSVAVDRRGARIGKGAGYSDLEVALLTEAGLLTVSTTIVTIVHALQVVEYDLPETDHDFQCRPHCHPGRRHLLRAVPPPCGSVLGRIGPRDGCCHPGAS